MLEVIVGCMYSGKTSELLRRIRLSEIAGLRCSSFKHGSDQRYSREHIATHPNPLGDSGSPPQYALCTPVPSAELKEALQGALSAGSECIAIDEIQFFDREVMPWIVEAADQARVVVAGLTLDARGFPFPIMPELLSNADDIQLLHAVCTNKVGPKEGKQRVCGRKATRTLDLTVKESKAAGVPLIAVGSYERYAARCRPCWVSEQTKR